MVEWGGVRGGGRLGGGRNTLGNLGLNGCEKNLPQLLENQNFSILLFENIYFQVRYDTFSQAY